MTTAGAARQARYREQHPERVRAAIRRWSEEHPDRVKLHDRRHKVKAAYGMTLEEYDAMLAEGCRICGGPGEVADHSHETGKVRGPLCSNHNKGLGLFGDDPALLRAAADYLEETA